VKQIWNRWWSDKIPKHWQSIHAGTDGDRWVEPESYKKNIWKETENDLWVRSVGPSPIKTKEGWLILFHGIQAKDPGKFKLFAMLLDLKDPTKVKYRSSGPVLEPTEHYEISGWRGIVYSCGAVVKSGRLFVYYGGGDTVVGVASIRLQDLLDDLKKDKKVQFKKIKVVKKKLEEQKADLEIQLSKLEQLKEQLDQTKSSLETQRKGKEALLAQTRNSENRYQQVLSASNKEASDLQKEINDLDAAVRAKLGNRSISGSGTLAKPLDGVLTQRYGNTGFTALGYNFHNGVDIAGPCGTPVYASADGTVNNTGSGEGAYGNWITIKHTIAAKGGSRQIVTLYGHLRTIKIKNGQSVKRGDLIGYEGNTGNTTRLLYGPERGCHVHFTVFDAEGFGVAKGANVKAYGTYYVPYGYTYDPFTFF
jgi:murein DD-endopeptidase MepM/ murein hydrolase activator NlpD